MEIVAQGIAILGHFFNESTKSSLIGEKSPSLVTLILSATILHCVKLIVIKLSVVAPTR